MPGINDTAAQAEPNNEVEFDTTAALADISSDLFGQDEDKDGGEDSAKLPEGSTPVEPIAVEKTPPEEKAAEEAPVENTEAVQETGAPKTWTKEAITDWAAIPPRAQQEILKREQDMFKGMETYREKAELGTNYDRVVEPYRAALAAENIDPVGLFQSFAGNHYLLSRGTPAQKVQIAANLISGYGIDLEELILATANGPAPAEKTDPKVADLEARLSRFENQDQNARRESVDREVETFANDPANIYYNELGDDIVRLVTTGAASTLRAAYDLAVMSNPVTRQKEIDRMTSAKISESQTSDAGRLEAARKAKGANVSTTTKTRDGTIPVGSMDDTLAATLEKINSRG